MAAGMRCRRRLIAGKKTARDGRERQRHQHRYHCNELKQLAHIPSFPLLHKGCHEVEDFKCDLTHIRRPESNSSISEFTLALIPVPVRLSALPERSRPENACPAVIFAVNL